MPQNNLFNEFDVVSTKAWKQKIQADLKGADYNTSLVWESLEGIKVKPFYTHEDMLAASPQPCFGNERWKIGHPIYAGNALLANKMAHRALKKRGVEALMFIVPTEEIGVDELLKDIDDAVPLYFDLKFLSASYVQKVVNFKGKTSSLHLQIDIIGNLAKTGKWYKNIAQDQAILSQILNFGLANTLQVNMSLYQNAGANMVQQLAYGLAHANEYMNFYKTGENDQEHGNLVPCFDVSIGGNYFFEIAKLRALRLLWQTLAVEYGVNPTCEIVAHPSKRNKTVYAYNTNMLRTVTESMAAILGGADVVFNMPYDAIYHKTNAFGERMAINQLLLLKNESGFGRARTIVDGNYYVESLTQQLADRALQLFKEIEKGGGFLKQLKNQTLQKKIKESARKEQELFECGKAILVGSNKYVDFTDRMKDQIELYPFTKSNANRTVIEPIIEKRLAEAMEQKRLANE